MKDFNEEMMEILKHTEKNNSGLFCGDSPDMQKLVKLELMESAGRKSSVPDEYFRLTPSWRIKLNEIKALAK